MLSSRKYLEGEKLFRSDAVQMLSVQYLSKLPFPLIILENYTSAGAVVLLQNTWESLFFLDPSVFSLKFQHIVKSTAHNCKKKIYFQVNTLQALANLTLF